MIRRPPRSTRKESSAASDVYKRQIKDLPDYKGDDPLTIRVYVFSQIEGVKPVKVFSTRSKRERSLRPMGMGILRLMLRQRQKSWEDNDESLPVLA